MPTTGDVALAYYDGTRWRTDTELAATPVVTYTPAAGLLLARTGGKLGFLGATPVVRPASDDQATVHPDYGSMYDNGGATTAIGVAGTFYKLSNTTASDLIHDFTHASNRLTYNGLDTLVFRVTANAAVGYGGGAGAKTLALRIAKNGTDIAASHMQLSLAALSDRDTIASQAMVSLATNDYVEVFGTNITDTNGLVVDVLNVNVLAIHNPKLVNRLRTDLITLGLIKGSA